MFQRLISFLLLLTVGYLSDAQTPTLKSSISEIHYDANVNNPLTTIELKQIKEVYGEYADKYVLDHPERLKGVKNILRNRVIIEEISDPKYSKEGELLSKVSLFTSFVKDLTRDDVFNPQTFNPLKYNFEFYSKHASAFKVDGTNYIIIIKSQYQ
ncbi:MAG: hypothetical protein HKN99_04670 [Winogradskyella sp.]|nr:hypothetical protein [Winogradskyella sp.]